MKTYVGIDVSKGSLDVAWLQGDTFRHLHLDYNNARAAKAILKALKHRNLHVVMEVTGTYSLPLATAFFAEDIPVSIVNPLCIKYFAKMKLRRAKTDRVDARTIAQYAASEQPPLWQPRPVDQERLRQVVSTLEDLLSVKGSLTNRQEAAAQLPDRSPACDQALAHLVAEIDQQIATLEDEMQRLARAAHKEAFERLLTIKGIGIKTAAAFVALCGGFESFETAAQVAAFVGINPGPYSSGTSVKGRGGISKRGHGIIRKLLYMGATSAAQYNPACQALSERLRAQGKEKNVVRVAVAHKLLRQAFGVVKGGKNYDPNYGMI